MQDKLFKKQNVRKRRLKNKLRTTFEAKNYLGVIQEVTTRKKDGDADFYLLDMTYY